MKMRIVWMMAGCLLAAACAEGGPTDAEALRHELAGGERVELRAVLPQPLYDGGVETRERSVVRSGAEWRTAWSRIWRGHHPTPETPVVDFDREAVVVAAMGSRATGGYAIRVDSAVATPAVVHVFVTEQSPSRSCLTTQAFTAPVDVVAIPADGRLVRFHENAVVRACG